MLFATNLSLNPGEEAAAVTGDAEDASHAHYPLTVEYVGAVTGFEWMSSVVVRLNDTLGDVGDVLVGITLHGATSNRVRVGIGHIGGGPPDDPPASTPVPDLGPGASLHGKQVFPPDNPWNQDISTSPIDPNSNNLIASIGLDVGLHPDFGTVYAGAPNGIPYIVVAGSQSIVPINFTAYGDESDPGPYPVPPSAPIEGGPSSNGDRHVIVIVYPARHFASSDTSVNRPPMGMRVRLKSAFDISGFSPALQVILRVLKKYGMIVADNGSNWYISGGPDPRWNDDELSTLKTITGSNFEVVQMGTIVTQ